MYFTSKTIYAISSAAGFALVVEIFGEQIGISGWNQVALVVFALAFVFSGLKSLQEK